MHGPFPMRVFEALTKTIHCGGIAPLTGDRKNACFGETEASRLQIELGPIIARSRRQDQGRKMRSRCARDILYVSRRSCCVPNNQLS
ncbi:hypothetical protein C8N36_103301 [Pelagimonas varians]|uniref:Uncharacterized protein n=1 Tax=Pelagimonas varians TaxID=696760 RepID=A0A238KSV9_9RHOB|nr:hypothetical protein C8N36_103301 [Pelagimonas varians]SMX45913.1 hypothetical protein PEV8663_03145 [Pelagimonas varians]